MQQKKKKTGLQNVIKSKLHIKDETANLANNPITVYQSPNIKYRYSFVRLI